MRDEIIPYDGRSLPQPWLRMGCQATRHTTRFNIFLGLGEGRTLTKCAEHLHITRQSVSAMAKRWHWDQRTRAYDNWKALRDSRARSAEIGTTGGPIQPSRQRTTEPHRRYLEGLQECVLATKVAADLVDTRAITERSSMVTRRLLPSPVVLVSQIPERPNGYCYVQWGEGKR